MRRKYNSQPIYSLLFLALMWVFPTSSPCGVSPSDKEVAESQVYLYTATHGLDIPEKIEVKYYQDGIVYTEVKTAEKSDIYLRCHSKAPSASTACQEVSEYEVNSK